MLVRILFVACTTDVMGCQLVLYAYIYIYCLRCSILHGLDSYGGYNCYLELSVYLTRLVRTSC